MTKYLVSHSGQVEGPWTTEEIAVKVRAKQLELFDYIFDELRGDWILLMEFPDLAEKLKSAKPPRPPKIVQNAEVKRADVPEPTFSSNSPAVMAHTITEWYVLKGENRFGPFSYTDVVKMLQQKVVFPFDFIWHAGLDNWQRLVEQDSFRPESIRELFSKTGQGKDVFSERKFPRKQFAGGVIVHDNLSIWKGEGFEISRGGVGINMGNTIVVPGQQVYVHFKKHGDWPAFNALCEVVSKKFVTDDSQVQYGLRFLSLTQEVQTEFYKKVT